MESENSLWIDRVWFECKGTALRLWQTARKRQYGMLLVYVVLLTAGAIVAFPILIERSVGSPPAPAAAAHDTAATETTSGNQAVTPTAKHDSIDAAPPSTSREAKPAVLQTVEAPTPSTTVEPTIDSSLPPTHAPSTAPSQQHATAVDDSPPELSFSASDIRISATPGYPKNTWTDASFTLRVSNPSDRSVRIAWANVPSLRVGHVTFSRFASRHPLGLQHCLGTAVSHCKRVLGDRMDVLRGNRDTLINVVLQLNVYPGTIGPVEGANLTGGLYVETVGTAADPQIEPFGVQITDVQSTVD